MLISVMQYAENLTDHQATTRAYAGVIRPAALELSGTLRWSNPAPCAG